MKEALRNQNQTKGNEWQVEQAYGSFYVFEM